MISSYQTLGWKLDTSLVTSFSLYQSQKSCWNCLWMCIWTKWWSASDCGPGSWQSCFGLWRSDLQLPLIWWFHPVIIITMNIPDVSFSFSVRLHLILNPIHFTFSNWNNGQMQTFGPGLEWDVIYTAFNRYLTSFSKWFLPRFDNHASLHMMTLFFGKYS